MEAPPIVAPATAGISRRLTTSERYVDSLIPILASGWDYTSATGIKAACSVICSTCHLTTPADPR